MKHILVLNFFPAFFPPTSGGEQRYYYLYSHLSRYYDITLLSPTHPNHQNEVVEFNSNFREHRVPKENVHINLHKEMDSYGMGECSALVCALACQEETGYHQKYKELISYADVIIHEFPYMLDYDNYFGRDGKIRLYNSHNVEHILADQILKGVHKEKYVSYVKELEKKLVQNCNLIFATSKEERETFHKVFGCSKDKIVLAPNGFEASSKFDLNHSFEKGSKKTLGLNENKPSVLFLGSGHPPNIEAVSCICEFLAPSLPGVEFLIIGSVCTHVTSAPANVKLLGFVDEKVKNTLFATCDLAINPMFSGAGTNLKMLDCMSSGMAIVTTPTGARGLEIEDGVHCIISEKDLFVQSIARLLANSKVRNDLKRAARELAQSKYSWSAIAYKVHSHIHELLNKKKKTKKQLLLLNDFPVSSPSGGGEVRINKLFSCLSEEFDVVLLCLSDDKDVNETFFGNVREIRVPKTEDHIHLEYKLNARHYISVNDIVSSMMCRENKALVSIYSKYMDTADAIILQHPYMAPLLDNNKPKVPVVYEAHNVEENIKNNLLSLRPDFKKLIKYVAKIESVACNVADKIICVSDSDMISFAKKVNKSKILIIENGVGFNNFNDNINLHQIKSIFKGCPVAIFVGSGHPPNIEAVEFIIDTLASLLPKVYFLIVGSSCESFKNVENIPNNVLLCGFVEDEVKGVLLKVADIALNPMFSGGGSSLKVAEYLAAGLPVISTAIGIRGFGLIDGNEVLKAEPKQFADKITMLLNNEEMQKKLRVAGFKYASERLDWKVLARKYGDELNILLGSNRNILPFMGPGRKYKNRRKLLVLTYRFTDPPLGGAEVYLYNVLKEINSLGDFDIDIVTFSVTNIRNYMHFSANYTDEKNGSNAPYFVNNLLKFEQDNSPPEELVDGCKRLFSMWQKEDLRHARLFIHYYKEITLMGGWYLPEKNGPLYQRWTSECAELFCPAHVETLNVKGFTNGNKKLVINFEDNQIKFTKLRGSFDFNIDLSVFGEGVLSFAVDANFYDQQDPRKLGICITEIVHSYGEQKSQVPLINDFIRLMRLSYPEKWVSSLIEITNGRNVNDDYLFFNLRGPQSRKLQNWLSKNIRKYDIVLAQGVPFSTSVIAVQHCEEAEIPCVLLPHYHMDDKYYHWQSFYKAFQSANLVLAAPELSKKYFFDKINVNSYAVPGGGIQPDEFTDLEENVRKFRKIHRSPRPFVLVLGRKTGAKNYRQVIEAVEDINRKGYLCDLVMIGIDEDKEVINSQHVKYYGNQPREFVLGSLASCLCVVSMSESESFGIVIIEAWMTKKPVIANSNCIASIVLIEHYKDGILCTNTLEVSSAIEYLINNPYEADAYGERGYRKVIEKYSWKNIAKEINNILKNEVSS